MRINLSKWLLAILALIVVLGCGQKKPLYLPDSTQGAVFDTPSDSDDVDSRDSSL